MEGSATRKLFFSNQLKVVQQNKLADGQSGYYPLNLRVLIPSERLTFTLYLKVLAGTPAEVKYLPCFYSDEVLTKEWLTKLREMRVEKLYFQQNDLDNVIAYINNVLFILDNEDEYKPAMAGFKLRVLFDHLNLTLVRAYNNLNKEENVISVVKGGEQIMDELEKNPLALQPLWDLLLLEYRFYNHAANVFLIALTMMKSLKKKSDDCKAMGLAALFFDVGMTKISEDIIYKSGVLKANERLQLENHPQTSFEIMKKYSYIPLDTLRLIVEHHENFDGSGYPQRLDHFRQHSYTPVLRLVDAFTALISPRPFRPGYPPFKAIKILQEQHGPKGPVFDHRLILTLVKKALI
jgi:HD-GYP domain-containing protein (c-di-GMP phosphodiesterase class II)